VAQNSLAPLPAPFLTSRSGVAWFLTTVLLPETRIRKGIGMKQDKKSSPRIIKSRFKMMGERLIPQEAFENLTEEGVKIFLTEPDPDKWPPKLSHLRKHVPEDTAA